MKRYAAYDPPEYVDWKPEPEAMDEFRVCLTSDPVRAAIISTLHPARHLSLYTGLVRNRLHDIALKRWVKQGVISKAWLGTGEEAVTVGAVQALSPGDQVGPMIRNAGACHEMGMPVADMLRAYLGTYDTITRGRDLHTGDPTRGVIPPISMVAALVPVFSGIALAFKQQGKPHVALTWVGDGATRTQEFHEGASFAARHRLPVIFVIQNNQVALGTDLRTGVAGDLRQLHRAYGVAGMGCEGNNVLDVFAAVRHSTDLCRQGEGPVFVEAETFRMGGHATHDEAEARSILPPEQFTHWGRRDPIGMYESWLVESGPHLAEGDRELAGEVLAGSGGGIRRQARGRRPAAWAEENRRILSAIEERVIAEVDRAAEEALASRDSAPTPPDSAADDLYAPQAEPGDPA
jgi:2-oxoisovalerate dehydrogenase E1 component